MTRKLMMILSAGFSFAITCMGPEGLKNVGNTCFINAGLQCLSALSDFKRLMGTREHCYNPGSFTAAFCDFLKTKRDEVDLELLCTQVWSLMNQAPKTQQDSDEFLTGFMKHLTETDLLEPNACVADEIKRLFSSRVRSQLSHEPEAFMSDPNIEQIVPLSLPVERGDILLDQCLHRFFQGEKVDFTLKSGKQVTANKRFSLEHTGKYLLITLKRKIYNEQQQVCRLNDCIAFPLKDISLKGFFNNPFKNPGKYELCSAIMHAGDANGGHYVAYVRHNQAWYYCNDETITLIPLDQMEAIAHCGYGENENFVVSTLIYERSSEPYELLRVEPWASKEAVMSTYNQLGPSLGLLTNDKTNANEIDSILQDAYNQIRFVE